MSSQENRLIRRIHLSARYLDDQDFNAFLELFLEDGEYSIVVQAPELPGIMTWMQGSKAELTERFAAVPRHEWEIKQQEQTRLVSVDMLDINSDKATTSSSFAIFNTDTDGRSGCYAVGRYDDRWQKCSDNWCLAARRVVLKTRLLTVLSPLPL